MSFWRSTMVGLCLLLMCAITRLKGKPYVKIQSFLNYFHLLSPLALKLHNSVFLFYIINLLWYVYILQFQCIYSVQYIFKVFWNMYKNQDSADRNLNRIVWWSVCFWVLACLHVECQFIGDKGLWSDISIGDRNALFIYRNKYSHTGTWSCLSNSSCKAGHF